MRHAIAWAHPPYPCKISYSQVSSTCRPMEATWRKNFQNPRQSSTLREKFLYSELFWSIFSRIRTESGPE